MLLDESRAFFQFDTLPVKVDRIEDMKPGDLVFVSGIYFNEKSEWLHACHLRICYRL